ncbi:MAG: hypothetical protein ACRD2L_12100, partial [Terriglobia bacterium]
KKYDPAEFQRIRTELEALTKDRNTTEEIVFAKLTPILLSVVQKAMTQTSDDAVVQWARAKLAYLEEVATANADDCYLVISGKADAAFHSRLLGYMSPQSMNANKEASIRVIEGAAGRPRQPLNDEARYARLIAQLETKLKAVGLTTNSVFYDTPGYTSKERCAAGIQIFREALNLKEPDRAFVLRMLLT